MLARSRWLKKKKVSMTESPPPDCTIAPRRLLSALVVPFSYFFLTRVPTGRQKIGWAFSYLLPVLALSVLGERSWTALPLALLMIVAVYAAYEFGYIVNDTITVDREALPTQRLDSPSQQWIRARLGLAFGVRGVVGAALAIVAGWSSAAALSGLVAWLAIWPLFALYNWWRGWITIPLYLLLASLRFLLPIGATAGASGSLSDGLLLLLLLLYPLPNTIVAVWKPRYGLPFLKNLFGTEHQFRLVWHGVLLAGSLVGAWLAPAWVSWQAVIACAYYVVIRVVSGMDRCGTQASGSQPSSNFTLATLRLALGNMVWILGDKALAMALGLLIFGMIGRALGPVGAGHFAFAAALLQVALGLSLVCSASGLLPRFCRMQAALPGAIANVFIVRMVASLASLGAVSIYCLLVIDIPERRTVSMVLLLAVPLIEPFAVIAMYWNSRNHNSPNVIARTSGLLARTACIAIGIALGAAWWLLAMAWVLEAAINAFIQTVQLRAALPGRPWLAFVSRRRCAAYLRFGARFVIGSWLHVLYTRLDRLLLGERMAEESFGLYATAMQLMDVWIQVANLIGVSLATAYLYRRIRAGSFLPAFFGTAGLMSAVGLAGLAGAWLFGAPMLRLVFGAPFAASQPYLLSGAALAVLLFGNQIVQLTMATLGRPKSLVIMWLVAVAVAVPAIVFGYDVIGAHAGPAGLAAGLLVGWISLAFTRPRSA